MEKHRMMKINGYLVVTRNGIVKVRRSKPPLAWNEVAIRIELNVPEALFTRPMLEAKITIPEDAVNKETIPFEVIDNCKEAIEQASGMKVCLKLIPPEEK